MEYIQTKIKEFLEDGYYEQILENGRKGQAYLNIDFKKIIAYDPDLANTLLDKPKEIIERLEISIESITDKKSRMQVGIFNLLETEEREINRIRKNDLGKIIVIHGIIVSRDKVRPRYINITFECSSCGAKLIVPQVDKYIKIPKKCSCGRKSGFKEVARKFENVLSIKLEDPTERLKGTETPYSMTVELADHCAQEDYNLNLGSRIRVTGILEYMPITKRGKTLNICDYVLKGLSYESQDCLDFSTTISPEEQVLFDAISQSPNPAKMISKFIFPDIYKLRKHKELCIYQQFSGGLWESKRDFIHILLLGSPGTAKTDIALRIAEINPIANIATGSHMTGVGLTAAIVKDELTGQFVAKGGLLARCNGGLAVIDEIDKMSESDKRSLHTPMESGNFSVNKAGISAKMASIASILATANPKCEENPESVDLPAAIKDRFDFILSQIDVPDKDFDRKVASLIVGRATLDQFQDNIYHNPDNGTTFEHDPTTFRASDTTFEHLGTIYYILSIKKYIYICKKIKPVLSRRVSSIVNDWYVQVRQASMDGTYTKKIPTPRAVESILRLARAISRSKMKNNVTRHELRLAMKYNEFLYGKNKPFEVIEEEIE